MAKKKKQQVFQSAFNSYHYAGEIGSGGSGIVVKVEDEDRNIFALKYLNPDRITTDRLKRFKNELSFCEKNEHPNIIKVKDHGHIETKDVKCPFYVMPYYPETLRTLMKKGISPTDVLPFFSRILNGIEAAHLRDIWHRDIKPENILSDPTANALVIADFGIAHFEEDFLHTAVVTKPQARLANFQYAAPEQKIPGERVDHRADIYALGMILNEMFTGKPPDGAKFKRVQDVSPDHAYLDSLIDLMLHQNPDQRPQDIGAIKKELIARGNAFVSEQRLSQLKKTVVPKYESDDPLINSPVKLVGVDYNNGALHFKLNQTVNHQWVREFHNLGNFSYIMGYKPDTFEISGDRAVIRVEERLAQDILNHFKEYVNTTNLSYRNSVQRHLQAAESQDREDLEAKVKAEEKRQRILSNLQI